MITSGLYYTGYTNVHRASSTQSKLLNFQTFLNILNSFKQFLKNVRYIGKTITMQILILIVQIHLNYVLIIISAKKFNISDWVGLAQCTCYILPVNEPSADSPANIEVSKVPPSFRYGNYSVHTNFLVIFTKYLSSGRFLG